MTFTDNRDRVWEIPINYTTITKVRKTRQIDLSRLVEPKVLAAIFDDVCLMIEIAHDVCADQIKARGVQDIDFIESIAGDPVDEFGKGLVRAVAFFMPAGPRSILLAELTKATELSERMTTEMLAEIQLIETSSKSASSSPALPESAPKVDVSGNSASLRKPRKKSSGTARRS